MANLLEETIEMLASRQQRPKDVRWVGTSKVWFTWDEFAAIANIEYDEGYGAAEVCSNLKIVGDDFWLERHAYDGSEWWEYKTEPSKPEMKIIPTTVISQYSGSVEEVNGIKD